MRRIFRTFKLLPAPILICDEPAEGSEVSRGTVVSGWAYSSAGIREVSIWLDGRRVGLADLGPQETLNVVFDFLDLPEWEPEGSELGNKRNTGGYEEKMDPATRRRLEEYFEPHNRKLYDYLGVDFGW